MITVIRCPRTGRGCSDAFHFHSPATDPVATHLVTVIWDLAELTKAENALTATIRATLRAEAEQTD
jgi:hypothetical protein